MQNDYPVTIFDQVADIITEEMKTKSATEIGRLFNRERKAIYGYRDGCTFTLNYDVIIGLSKLGYRIVIEKK